jgi:sugar phosphate isomerase/epimerase
MFEIGIVTYNIAKDWDLDTILKKLEDLKFGGVELRTGHKHGVEVGLTAEQREVIRKKFEDSPVELAGLGSAFEFQSSDPAQLRANIDGAKAYVRLAHDVGSPGVKVRPNGLAKGVEPEATYEQIGKALVEVARDAADFGVEIRVEVHGASTQLLPEFAKIMARADHPNVGVCWNSNPTDVVEGSIKAGYALVGPRIKEVHLRDLTDETYPWRELFALLAQGDFEGYTLAEIPESPDAERVLKYFRSLWLAYQPMPRLG